MLIAILPIAANPQATFAAVEPDGNLDLPFDAGTFTNGQVDTAALQPDGKLIIGGQFNKVHGAVRHGVARLNQDGTLDLSFDPGINAGTGIKTAIIQADGKIIIVGAFGGIRRLNSDGSLDAGFNLDSVLSYDGLDNGSGTATNPGYAIAAVLQSDGKIVVVGQFFYVITGPGTSVARSCVARFNNNGTFDPSYNPGTGAFAFSNTVVNYAARQNVAPNSGKILIQGNFDSFDDHTVPGLARLNPDGSFDTTFNPGSATFSSSVSGLFVQSDDQILVFGSFTSFNGVTCSNITRLNNSGGVDGGFSTDVFQDYGESGTIAAVGQQPNGKLIVGGYFHSLGGLVANNVVRLETNGARDGSFGGVAAGPSAWFVSAVLVRSSDSKIFLGGYFSTFGAAPRNNMAWVNSNGSTDNVFDGLGGAIDNLPEIFAIAVQPDGKILVGGLFSSLNGASHYNLVRLNPDATVDPSFDASLGTDGSVRSLLLQPDGKIVIGGVLQAVNGVARGRIARLNSNGTLDGSFDPGAGANSTIFAMAQDSSGNIFVGGSFTAFNGIGASRFTKLTPTGSVDSSFNPGGAGANDAVYAITGPDGNGNIVIAGNLTRYNNLNSRRIARLNATSGAIDTGFNFLQPGFNGTVNAVVRASDGKYYAGGIFTTYNSISRPAVARLNSDGSLDGAFIPPSSLGQTIFPYALALQNGKVFVAGIPASGSPGLLRLTSNGAVDPAFATGTSIEVTPLYSYPTYPRGRALSLQADGKLLLGGLFNQYNGTPRIDLARFTISPVVPTPTPTATPISTATPTPTPTPTPGSTATPSATSTPTPTATPGSLGNISTRLRVLSGDNALIGGMIATGTASKKVIIRAIGPTLNDFGVPGALQDPTLELYQGSLQIASNDDWRQSSQQSEIQNSGLAPNKNAESAIIATLTPNQNYTAIVRGKNGETGVGVVEAFDLEQGSASKLGNISTRGFVNVDDNVMIAGLIVSPSNGTGTKILVRAMGPTLGDFGVSGFLADPTLELVNSSGTVIRSNDNWKSDQRSEIEAANLAPGHDEEAALVQTVSPGAYTAVVRGAGRTTGVGLVEAYNIQ